jgi:exodeoxyribonuclease VII large subunit
VGAVAQQGGNLTELFPDERHDVLSIGSLMSQLQVAVAGAFPRGRGIWVRGEIQSIDEHRSGHCYMELVDPDTPRGRERPVLRVNCWRTTWGPIRKILGAQGLTLQAGMLVTLRGRVELYAPRAQVNLIAAEVDVAALLGRMAAQRAALLAALETEGLLRRNASLALAAVPLTVGLVASPGTEGFDDFLGQLRGSGFGFSVRLVPVQVQGARAATSIANGLALLSRHPSDLTVVVRGGGARSDLAAFDTEPVARAVASHPVPVWTGIGHTGDQSVADIVAHSAFVTPTECGHELVRLVASWCDGVSSSARRLGGLAPGVIETADAGHAHCRQRLVGAARAQLHRHSERTETRAARVAVQVRRQLDAAAASVDHRALRLGPLALMTVSRQDERIGGLRRLLSAYDVERQLERGYTLTLDARGRLVRSASVLHPGDSLVTRFPDGTTRSTVEYTSPHRPNADEDSP